MAIIHPRLSPTPAKQGGFHREMALLEMLRVGLPDSLDMFQGVASYHAVDDISHARFVFAWLSLQPAIGQGAFCGRLVRPASP